MNPPPLDESAATKLIDNPSAGSSHTDCYGWTTVGFISRASESTPFYLISTYPDVSCRWG